MKFQIKLSSMELPKELPKKLPNKLLNDLKKKWRFSPKKNTKRVPNGFSGKKSKGIIQGT